MGGVDVDGAGRAGEGGGLAGGVEPVALGDGIGLAFGGPAAGALGGFGVQEEAKISVGEDDGADIAAFHDKAGKAVGGGDGGLAALVGEQGGAHGGQGGEMGDGGVDGGGADLVFGDGGAGDGDGSTALVDGGAEGEGGEGSCDDGGVAGGDA